MRIDAPLGWELVEAGIEIGRAGQADRLHGGHRCGRRAAGTVADVRMVGRQGFEP
jgi:hypothetical protein